MPRLRKGQSKAKSRSIRKRSHQETDSSLAPAIRRRVETIPGDLTGAAADACVALVAERDALAAHLKLLKMKKKRLQEQLWRRRANKLDGLYLCIAENTHRALSPGKYGVAADIPPHLLVRASLRRGMSVADVMAICEHSYHSRYKESSPQNLLQIFMLGSTRICLHFPDDDTIICVLTELCSLRSVLNTEHIVATHQFLDIDLPFLSEAALTAFSRVTAPLCFMHIALRIRRADPTINALGKLSILHSLDLSKTYITDDDVKALRENPTLVKIYMNECMCLRDVSPLADILTLEEVELSECSYLSIVGALGKLPALRSLNLRGTCITNDELKALCESRTLLTIVLTDCHHLTDVSSLASVMTLQDVQLCNGSFITGLENLGELPVLSSLDLRNTFHETDLLTSLSMSRTLVKLDLGKCRCLRDVSPLATIQTLRELSLSGCYLPRGIATLGELRNLLSLDLSKTSITSDELFGIRKLPSLEKLDLSRCHLLKDVSCLAHVKSLKEVRLQRKGDMGGLSGLYKLPLLHSLVMSKSYAIFLDIRFISECCALVKLDLHKSLRHHDVSSLASIKTLEEINLSKNPITGAERLGKLPALRILDLSMTNITDNTIVGISESRTLIKLILVECRSLKNVSPLSSIKTLNEIDLSSCLHITEVGKLGDLPALRSLNLEYTKINIDGLREISKSRTLVNLNMNFCTCCRPLNDVSPLANIKTLEEVRLRGCDDTSGLDALCELPALRILDIGQNDDDEVLRVIQRCCFLVQLNMSDCWNIKHVSMLASINSLTEIDLSGCRNFEDLDTLGQLPSLRFLKLIKCELDTFSLRGISNSPSLVMLDLSKCERLMNISPLLRIHTLEELYLTECMDLDSYCTGELGKSHALRILNLRGTRINNNTLLGLSESHTLVKLDVSYCYSLTDASPLASIKTLGELVLLGCYDHLLPSALRALAIRLKYEEDYCSDEDF